MIGGRRRCRIGVGWDCSWVSGLRAAMIESCHRAASGDIVIVQLACAWKLKRFTTRTVDFQLIARSRVDGGAAKI